MWRAILIFLVNLAQKFVLTSANLRVAWKQIVYRYHDQLHIENQDSTMIRPEEKRTSPILVP